MSGPTTEQDADLIANHLLEQTGRAMMTRYFALFAKYMHLPHRIANFDETFEIHTVAKLRTGFVKVCDELALMGVTDFVRVVIAAEMIDETTMHFSHISHLMVNDQRAKPPYPCFSIVRKVEGRWKLAATDYAIAATTGQARAMKSGAHVQTETDPGASAAEARASKPQVLS